MRRMSSPMMKLGCRAGGYHGIAGIAMFCVSQTCGCPDKNRTGNGTDMK